MIRQLIGDCRVQLASLAPESVQAVITSPPYYGLRDYGTEPLVWGANKHVVCTCGRKDFCAVWCGTDHEHEWGPLSIARAASYETGEKARWNHRVNGRGEAQERILAKEPGWTRKDVAQGQHCPCGAWLGSLGLEPTPELFIEHLVEVFRGVRRVLRSAGVLWVNLGDSYAGSGGNGYKQTKDKENRSGAGPEKFGLQRIGPQIHTEGAGRQEGYKPKDLMMLPARLAMALQADGWYLRSMIPWLKRNSMPESVTDRPATAVEYVFLLSKSRTYLWDADAVRVGYSPNTESFNRMKARFTEDRTTEVLAEHTGQKLGRATEPHGGLYKNGGATMNDTGRNRRNSDWFFESWQGLMLDEQDDPLALVVNPQPFSASRIEHAYGGGKSRKVSPDCSIHGAQAVPVGVPSGDEPPNASRIHRNRRSDLHPSLWRDDALPAIGTDQSAIPSRDSSASGRSNGSHKTDSRSEQRDKDGEVFVSGIAYSGPRSSDHASDGHMTANNTSPGASSDGLDSDPSEQTPTHTGHKCTCQIIDHFAVFPPKLVEPMVKASTCPGDTVLDPFSGAGTVSLVADRLGRNAIGIDLKDDYAAMATDRLTGDSPMFVELESA